MKEMERFHEEVSGEASFAYFREIYVTCTWNKTNMTWEGAPMLFLSSTYMSTLVNHGYCP